MTTHDETIAAIATGVGGAISVIRVSGDRALGACDAIFRGKIHLAESEGGRFHYGRIADERGATVDDVVVSVFRAPHSYTGEDVVEISCHGSRYVQQKIIQLLIDQGIRPAGAGEFSMRAVMNGKLDLAQVEAVADLIASENRASHAVAINQMRGRYSSELQVMRSELVTLASLLELELDFGQEDVEFADRTRLSSLTAGLMAKIEQMSQSFVVGNVLKNGVAVAIVGSPNVGKSTLLNALLGDDRAMVSDIAGTTRDTLEEYLDIDGVRFRFIDTAGLRETDDRLEQMGMERTRASIERADMVLLMVEACATDDEIAAIWASLGDLNNKRVCVVANKIDMGEMAAIENRDMIPISALHGDGLDRLSKWLLSGVDVAGAYNGEVLVTSARHHESLERAGEALRRVEQKLSEGGIPADLLSQDIREALYNLGSITGEITTDDLLGEIFSKFCIGK